MVGSKLQILCCRHWTHHERIFAMRCAFEKRMQAVISLIVHKSVMYDEGDYDERGYDERNYSEPNNDEWDYDRRNYNERGYAAGILTLQSMMRLVMMSRMATRVQPIYDAKQHERRISSPASTLSPQSVQQQS